MLCEYNSTIPKVFRDRFCYLHLEHCNVELLSFFGQAVKLHDVLNPIRLIETEVPAVNDYTAKQLLVGSHSEDRVPIDVMEHPNADLLWGREAPVNHSG